MAERRRDRTRFDAPGTLTPPGPIGRAVRLGWGVFLLWGAVTLPPPARELVELKALPPWSFLAVAAFTAVKAFPYAVTIGFGLRARYRPLWGALAAANLLGVAASWGLTGVLWSPALGAFVLAWMTYTLVHLGVSFLAAAWLATPGCEMRALPQWLARWRGARAEEHFCPGHLDGLDRWEARRRA